MGGVIEVMDGNRMCVRGISRLWEGVYEGCVCGVVCMCVCMYVCMCGWVCLCVCLNDNDSSHFSPGFN